MVCTEETAREMNAGVWLAVSSYKVEDPSPENEVMTFRMGPGFSINTLPRFSRGVLIVNKHSQVNNEDERS